MKKSFEIDRATDPKLLDVTISDENGSCIEITASTQELTTSDRLGIRAFIMGHNNHSAVMLNFHIDDDCEKYARVVGNIPEALEFLQNHKFISGALCLKIKANDDIAELLNKSSRYVEPPLETEFIMPELNSDDEMMRGIEARGFNEEKTPEVTEAYFDSKKTQNGKPNAEQENVTPSEDGLSRPGSPPPIKVK